MLLDQIWAEIDTQHRLQRLMTQLEECISFLLSTSVQSRNDDFLGGDELSDPLQDTSTEPNNTGRNLAEGAFDDEGNVLLEDFVLNTLLVDPNRWKAVSGTIISQQVCLFFKMRHYRISY